MCSFPSGSVSFSRTLIVTGLVPSVSTQSSAATGRLTRMLTVAEPKCPAASRAVYRNLSVQANHVFAVYVMAPVAGSTVTLPLVGARPMRTLPGTMPPAPTSLASTSTVTVLVPSVSAKSSLTPADVAPTTVTVPGADVAPASSVIVYWNLSVSLNPAKAVYVTAPVAGSTVAVPCCGAVVMVTLPATMCSFPSGSVSFSSTLIVTGVVPSNPARSSAAVGRLTWTRTVAGAEVAPVSSVTTYRKLSVPMKFADAV